MTTPARPIARARDRGGEQGSIALFMAVLMVATGLIVITLVTVERGLAGTKRSGDSASALQIADAGVNAAVQQIPNIPPGDPAAPLSVGPNTGGVGTGTYEWRAERVTPQLWNVTSIGTDVSGVRRRVQAQARALPVFSRPIQVRSTASLKAGNTLDSYSDADNRCTKYGTIAVDDPSTLSFTGNGVGNANCQSLTNPSWKWSVDGCELPGDDASLTVAVPTKNKWGENLIDVARCPDPPFTKRVSPKLPLTGESFPVNAVGAVGSTTTPFTCDPTHPLLGGTTYLASTLTLKDGCFIQSPNPTSPVHAYATTIDIGVDNGGAAGDVVNPPRAGFKSALSSLTCGGYTKGDPTVPGGYCGGWVSQLHLHLVGQGTVTFRNKVRYFWGVISAPEGAVNISAQQLEAWGAIVTNTYSSGTQFTWHFDDSLRSIIGSGRFGVTNWREEPLGG